MENTNGRQQFQRQAIAKTIRVARMYTRYREAYWAGIYMGIAFTNAEADLNRHTYNQVEYCSMRIAGILKRENGES